MKSTPQNSRKQYSKRVNSPSYTNAFPPRKMGLRNNGSQYPPPMVVQKTNTLKIRYNASSAVADDFTIGDGHNQFIVATTAVLGNSYVECWRLKKIAIWAAVDSTVAEANISLRPLARDGTLNSFNAPDEAITDTTVSVDRPAHVQFVTNIDNPNGSWHYTTTINSAQILYSLVCTQNAVVEMTFEYRLNLVASTLGYTTVLVGATAGALYARSPMTGLVVVNQNTL
jgi:hypothetical protein